jgi:hypothetical protein
MWLLRTYGGRMKTNRAGLADVLGCSLPSIDRWQRDGMPVERGRNLARFDTADCIRWLRYRDAARALPPPLIDRPRESRASRQERRDALHTLWLPKDCLVPWSHAYIEPLDVWERGVGIDGTGEVIDLIALGLRILPPAGNGSELCRVSLPHAANWRSLLAVVVGRCGGDARTPFLGREMRRLCDLPLADDEDDMPSAASEAARD